MNALTPVLVLTVIAGAVVIPARAQLVHLTLEASESSLKLRGDIPDHYPWDTGGMVTTFRPVRLDVFYDASLAKALPDPVVGWYRPTDPSRNFWRVHFQQEGTGQVFDLSRPLSDLFAYDVGMDLSWGLWGPHDNESVFLALSFSPPLTLNGGLPVPPLPGFDPDFGARLEIDGSIFGLDGLAEGMLRVNFDSLRAEIVPAPEASTYGIGAAALAGVVILVRHWRCRRPLSGQRGDADKRDTAARRG